MKYTPSKHVDDFIDDTGTPGTNDPDNYARFFLNLHRMSAVKCSAWRLWISQFKLFCTFEGLRYRVTGASRLGDVWLTSNFKQDTGYEKRVGVDGCSLWGQEP